MNEAVLTEFNGRLESVFADLWLVVQDARLGLKNEGLILKLELHGLFSVDKSLNRDKPRFMF